MSAALFKMKLQALVPYYRNMWSENTFVLRHWLNEAVNEFQLSRREGEPIAIRQDGLKLIGMGNTLRERRLLIKFGGDRIFNKVEEGYFRLLSDIVVRFYFPHLLPYKYPMNISKPTSAQSYMEGFHGQHRDSVRQIEDSRVRKLFERIFRPSKKDVVIDCGSFIGFGALAVSPLVQQGKIIAVEASHNCFEILCANIDGNNIKNIIPVNSAVWSSSGVEMNLASGGVQANSLIHGVVADATKSFSNQPVLTKAIDDLVYDLRLKRVDMISLTINGAEPNALRGAESTLQNLRPRIRLAGWYQINGRPIAHICKEILEQHDYFVHVGKRNGLMAVPREQVIFD